MSCGVLIVMLGCKMKIWNVYRSRLLGRFWQDCGMREMIKQLKPQTILVYGGKLDFDYGGIDVRFFDNQVTERMKLSK